jgi:hypothetical protein
MPFGKGENAKVKERKKKLNRSKAKSNTGIKDKIYGKGENNSKKCPSKEMTGGRRRGKIYFRTKHINPYRQRCMGSSFSTLPGAASIVQASSTWVRRKLNILYSSLIVTEAAIP